MDATTAMTHLAETLDAHAWADLPGLLHDEFVCHYVHTGETFGKDAWVRLNADYPGFERFVLEDLVAGADRAADRAAGRGRVTGSVDGEAQVFGVATFITVRDGLIAEMTEVWTDVDQKATEGTRPS